MKKQKRMTASEEGSAPYEEYGFQAPDEVTITKQEHKFL
jgi:hypothetical protein